MVKKLIVTQFYLSLMLLNSCQWLENFTKGVVLPDPIECPKEPMGILETVNVKTIQVSSDKIFTATVQADIGKYNGFAFEGQSGQKLDYNKEELKDICIWVYTPDAQLLSSKTLPQTLPQNGKYIMQISALKEMTDFDIKIAFGSLAVAGFTEKEAVDLIKKWLNYKPRIFAPPYDLNLAGEILSEPRYSDVVMQVKWLAERNGYYRYASWKINSFEKFMKNDEFAEITIEIQEDSALYVNGRLDRSQAGNNPYLYHVKFKLDGTTWKISELVKT